MSLCSSKMASSLYKGPPKKWLLQAVLALCCKGSLAATGIFDGIQTRGSRVAKKKNWERIPSSFSTPKSQTNPTIRHLTIYGDLLGAHYCAQ
eukprot:1153605-Pelagomonas_calceolata.AAC.2